MTPTGTSERSCDADKARLDAWASLTEQNRNAWKEAPRCCNLAGVSSAAQTRSPTRDKSVPNGERISGSVERVTFHNAENGFCVLRARVRGQRDLVTITGHAAAIGAGDFIEATGIWINDRNHGLQFKAERIEATVPTTGNERK